jgi:hypothetical protein
MQLRIDELQAKITSFTANNQVQSAGNFDFKQKLIETKNFAKVSNNINNNYNYYNNIFYFII